LKEYVPECEASELLFNQNLTWHDIQSFDTVHHTTTGTFCAYCFKLSNFLRVIEIFHL